MVRKTLPETLIRIIRNEVKNGKAKIQVAMEYGLSYYMVKKLTAGIPTDLRITDELVKKIRQEIHKGKTKKQVVKKLSISRDKVIKYTRDIFNKSNKNRKKSEKEITRIRKCVLKYNSKSEAARQLGLSYSTISWYTKDIKLDKKFSDEKIKLIRKKVLNGTPKKQVARDLNVSWSTVAKYTIDIPRNLYYKPHSKGGGPQHLRGRTLILLKKLLINGYYIFSEQGDIDLYRTLRKHFPNIHRVRACGKTIIFLEDKSDIAAKALLEHINKKIMSYHELSQIMKVFDTNK
jgi:hypothetical protein